MFGSGSCTSRCPPCILATEMSYSTPSEIQRLPPALMGLCVAQQFDYNGRMQQKITRGETIAAREGNYYRWL